MNNQAAQTMHPDALPDGTLSKSTAKRVTALAAASVSERMLALADEIDRQARECPTVDWRPNAHENARNLRALEQALTQQRGCATCGGRGEIGGHVGQTAETFDYVTEPCPECTTPQPSADAVREVPDGMVLVPREPTEAMKAAGAACFPNRWGNGDATDGEDAADCYREMLSAASDHQQNAAQGGGEHG